MRGASGICELVLLSMYLAIIKPQVLAAQVSRSRLLGLGTGPSEFCHLFYPPKHQWASRRQVYQYLRFPMRRPTAPGAKME